MFKTKYTKSLEEQCRALFERVSKLELTVTTLESQCNCLAAELLNVKAVDVQAVAAAAVEQKLHTIDEERIARIQSSEPHFELITDVNVNDDGLTMFEMDWNPAFIQYLKTKGYVGKTDQDFIRHWVKAVATNVERSFDDANP